MQVRTSSQRVAACVHRVVGHVTACLARAAMRTTRVTGAVWQAVTPPSLETSAPPTTPALPAGVVTPQEAERLAAMRLWFGGRPGCLEFELVEWRLQFARWQVEHGQLTDFPGGLGAEPEVGTPWRSKYD